MSRLNVYHILCSFKWFAWSYTCIPTDTFSNILLTLFFFQWRPMTDIQTVLYTDISGFMSQKKKTPKNRRVGNKWTTTSDTKYSKVFFTTLLKKIRPKNSHPWHDLLITLIIKNCLFSFCCSGGKKIVVLKIAQEKSQCLKLPCITDWDIFK